jgi:hypothetical protein
MDPFGTVRNTIKLGARQAGCSWAR